MDKPPDRRFTEDEAKRLLERATRLENDRNALISESELRVIAAEAGIDPTALSAAISESMQQLPVGEADPSPSRGFLKGSLLAAGGIATLAALVTAVMGPGGHLFRADYLAVALLILADAYFLGRSLPSGKHRDFQLTNLVLWMGFPATWTVLRGSMEAFPACLAFGAAAAAIGALVITSINRPDGLVGRIRGFLKPQSDTKPSTDGPVESGASAPA